MRLRSPRLFREACLMDGAWINADPKATISVFDPSDGSLLARVPSLGPDQIELAISAADRALPLWSAMPARDRAAILRRWFDLIIANADDLAVLMTAEQGKPIAEAKGEIVYAASFVEWFAEEGKRVYGDVIPSPQSGKRIIVLKQPVGVCAAITPWNFPAAMITRKVAPALAAGCTMIVKPAEQTPLTALALGELAVQAGVPAGVLQIVTGAPDVVGGVLTRSATVRKLSFTGSTEIGRLLMSQCAPTVKRLSLELGGNAPFIVFDDANLDAAVDGAIASKYRNAGQTCVCANRLYVQDGIYDRFAERLTQRVADLKVGAGGEDGVAIGPLIDRDAVDKVDALIADAIGKGARATIGGGRHARGGLFYEPSVLVDVDQSMRFAREEIFGPVAPLFRFASEVDAVAMANDTEFGLAAYVYTTDLKRAWRMVEALEYGMIGHNTGAISNEVAPFGGMKQSGNGREGSKYGIDEYLEIKYWCSDIS